MDNKQQMTNEEKLDLFADLIEPMAQILADKEIQNALDGKPMLIAVKLALKKHPKAVVQMLARLENVPEDQYKITWDLPKKLLLLLNKPEIQDLFTLQGQKTDAVLSGSATENIEDGAN